MSDRKGKLLLAHWQKFLGMLKSSHATKEEQDALWREFLVIYTGTGLEEGVDVPCEEEAA